MIFKPKNMLVTGGAGFIGSNFIRYVLNHIPTMRIVNLDKLSYAGSLEHLSNLPHPKQHHFVQGDICDTELVASLLHSFEIDTIVHFAAESHVDRSIQHPQEFVQTNMLGTFVLLEMARHYWQQEKKFDCSQYRFHHISTDEVYGALSLNAPAFTESHPYLPRSPYSASKAGSDHLVRAYHHTYGLSVSLSHCSNNYGPYQHPEKFVPTIIRSCLLHQPIPLYGNGKQIRDWLYVGDHCSAILAIIQHAELGETYHIGGHCELENKILADKICKVMNQLHPQHAPHEQLIQFVTDRPGHDFRYAMDTTKIKNTLGWQPKESFVSGIEKTIAYYMSQLKQTR